MNDASANTAALYEQVRALRAEVRALRVAVGNPRGPGPRPRRRKQVLQLIRRRGPMTVPELSACAAAPVSSGRGRIAQHAKRAMRGNECN